MGKLGVVGAQDIGDGQDHNWGWSDGTTGGGEITSDEDISGGWAQLGMKGQGIGRAAEGWGTYEG